MRRHLAGLCLGVAWWCSVAAPMEARQLNAEVRRIHGLADAGQVAEAEVQARAYLKNHADSADAHFLLGYTLFHQRKPKESLAEYTEGARIRRPDASDLIAVGSDYVLLADYTDADKWFTQGLAWDPRNLQLLYYLGRTKYHENRFDEAVTLFGQCLAADPRNVKAQDNLALSYQGLGKTEQAEAGFRQALELQSGTAHRDADPYLNLGSLLVETERFEPAVSYLQTALSIDPQEVRAHRALGKAYLHLNRLTEAQSELEESVRMQPDQAATHFVLAQVYRRRGMADKAKEETALYSKLSASQSSPSK